MKVFLSPGALDDLKIIAAYIAQDDPERARTFTDELREACRELENFPRRYPTFAAGGTNAHRRNYGEYAIIYTVETDVDVVAVVHGARDLPNLF